MDNITKRYKKFKLKDSKETMKDFCLPKKFKLQPQQEFIPQYLWDNRTKINGLLLFHNIGSGKTCTAINIGEKFKNTMKILVVLPAALIGNFKGELRSKCPNGEDTYMTEKERNKLKDLDFNDEEYKNIILKSDKKIEKYYTIYSYHKFINLVHENKINLKNTLLIIDEIQNMISLTGTFYKTLYNIINKTENNLKKTENSLKLILLSATPMFDRPIEIGLTLNLLRPLKLFPVGSDFNNEFLSSIHTDKGILYKAVNMDLFKELSSGLVSYYRGAPPQAYPKMEFRIVKCVMNDFQYKSYLTVLSTSTNKNTSTSKSFKDVDILKLPSDFLLGPRMISNIAFPNKSIGQVGFSSFKNDILQLSNVEKYSIKFYKILKKIKRSEGPIFVYSNFKDIGGLKSFVQFIEYHGFKNYKTFGEGKKRFAVWSGDETQILKEEIKSVFNQKDNQDGSKIKIMLGSPSIKEGVSLLRVDQVHILEPYWNMSRILQIIGRAIRFCSHKDVIKSKQLVKVYLYLSTHPKEKESIDQYIWSLAKQKQKLIEQFEHVLKENAIDCKLFHARNEFKTDDTKIKCNN